MFAFQMARPDLGQVVGLFVMLAAIVGIAFTSRLLWLAVRAAWRSARDRREVRARLYRMAHQDWYAAHIRSGR